MVMDGRRPAGIMGGEDPYADPRLAAVYRALAESPDTAYRGSVLPFRRTTAGTTELAVPGFLMDAARGAVDLLAGPHTGQMSPEATQSIMGFAGSSAMQAPQPGLLAAIKAYHGSPHTFDRFSMDAIGTGEGAQAYGHGLYFAGNPDVAQSYQKNLSANVGNTQTAMGAADRAIQIAGGDKAKALESIDAHIRSMTKAISAMEASGMTVPEVFRGRIANEYEPARKLLEEGYQPGGSLYHVTLSPDEDDLLDWDAPLSQQPEKVRKALEGLRPRIEQGIADGHISPDYAQSPDQLTGEDIYQLLTSMEPWNGGPRTDQQSATALLRAAGIPGIRYFDGTSRKAGEGTRNYVMFDDKLVNIDKVER